MTQPPDRPLFPAASVDGEQSLEQMAQLAQSGQLPAAILLGQQLVQQHPEFASAWDLLGLLLLQQGCPQEALQALQQAIALNSNQANFYDHIGVVYCSLGNFKQGIQAYQQAIALNPAAVDTTYNLGLALQKVGRLNEALQTYLVLIAQQPNHALAHGQVGNLLQQQQQWTAAIAHYQHAVQLQPQYAEAWYNLGVAYQQLGDSLQAGQAYQQALHYKPQYAEALNGLGTLLEKQEQPAAALHHYQQALALQPNYIHTLLNLANLQVRIDRLSEARATYHQILTLDPQNPQVLDSLVKIQLRQGDWSTLIEQIAQLKAIAHARLQQGLPANISPLNSLFLPGSAAEQHKIAQSYAQQIAQKMSSCRQQLQLPNWSADRKPASSKIHLGYVSGDFRDHVVGHLIQRLFALHDRTQFEVFAYSLGPNDGSLERQTLEADCDCFREMHLHSASQIAQQVVQDQIDVLIDLAGYTDYACPELFALRSAPLQVNYLGYPGTLGADYIDYIIADPIVVPPHLVANFSERCLYLPESYQLNSYSALPQEADPANPQLAASSRFTFCCFNKCEKIEPQMFATWMRILAQVPDSVLWLLSDRPETEANLKATAAAQHIDPDRILFAPRVSKQAHLLRHAQADLFLDTLYYNAHVTASDSLWAGVPVLTTAGQTFASRVAASLLTAIGLPELITANLSEYEQLAVHLATHPQALSVLKQRLSDHRSHFPLFNTARTVRHLEQGYRLIWERYQSGQGAASIQIPCLDHSPSPVSSLPSPVSPSSFPSSSLFSPSAPSLPADTIACTADDGFCEWLSQTGGSLVITTYQAGKVVLVGWNGQQVTVLPRQFTKPMGVAIADNRLALATHQEVLLFANAPELAADYLEAQPRCYDALYLPRTAYFTGDLLISDLAYGDQELWVVNTRFSCLATLSSDFSFVPRWHPSFLSELAPDDRCHLNGLAMVAGKPKYVTALGKTDTARGWSQGKTNGGILIDVETQELLLQGLSIPHSPRWYQDHLWLLNSGTGELWKLDPDTWQPQVVCALPGFGRGLSFVGNYALVGLSQIRKRYLTSGLPLQQQHDRLLCGVAVVDLRQGAPVGMLEFTSGCHELYNVAFLPNVQRPMLLNRQKPAADQAITAPEFAYWLRSIAQSS
ncbi:MAG: hypothetical protein Kow00121_35140 [Elainellaceae cyanobacterium]